jgi:sugar lactone lactonase YvrE
MQYRQIRIISGKGSGPAHFSRELRGIALDARGVLYAAGDSEVKVFNAAGALARQWPTTLPPYSVAVAPDLSVWAGQKGQIEIFDGAGKLRRTWKDSGRMGCVTAIGFLKESVLVGDASKRCIHRFDAEGNFLNSIGLDTPPGGLLIPNGVVDFGVDPQGVIHAANPGKHRVERYSPEGSLLGHMGKFTGPDPAGFSGCCNPTNVAIAGPGLLCVTEKAGPRAKIYDYAGKLLALIESPDLNPRTKNMDVAVDARGHIFIADPAGLAIFEFEPAGDTRL